MSPLIGAHCARSGTSPFPIPADMTGEKGPEAGDSLPSGFFSLRGTRLRTEDERGGMKA